MDYQLRITKTLGVEEAVIELRSGDVTEVIGPNASGKTSVALAAAAVLSGNGNPLGLPATGQRRYYPHNGSDEARVELICKLNSEGEGGVEYVWHPATGGVVGPVESEFLSIPEAVGLVDFCARKGAKERAQAIQGALLPPPDEVAEQVRVHLAKYLHSDDLDTTMNMLFDRGWPATKGVYDDWARGAKRSWSKVTGQNYGSRIAQDWRPPDWIPDYDSMTIQRAEEQVVNARDHLDSLHREKAISQAEAEARDNAARAIPALEDEVDALTEELAEAKGHIGELRAYREVDVHNEAMAKRDEGTRHLKRIQAMLVDATKAASSPHVCPHCDRHLDLEDGVIVVFDLNVAENRVKEHTKLLTTAKSGLKTLESAVTKTMNALHELHDRLRPLEDRQGEISEKLADKRADLRALKDLSRMGGSVETAETRVAIEAAEQEVEDAKTVVTVIKAEAEARKFQKAVVRYSEVAAALGPEGVRAKLLDNALSDLNAGLAVLADTAGWHRVTISETGSVNYGDRPVDLCSESERWRAQACIQLTLGALTDTSVVVLDRADVLDNENRDGLVNGLNRVAARRRLAILVCATVARGEHLLTGADPIEQAPWNVYELESGFVAHSFGPSPA